MTGVQMLRERQLGTMGFKGIRAALFLLCTALTISAFFVTLRNRTARVATYSIAYGEAPGELMASIKKWVPNPYDGILGLFVFNQVPTASQIENVEKIARRHGDAITLISFFHSRFRSPDTLRFPHAFLFSKRVFCRYEKMKLEGNFFLLLVDGRLVLADQDPNLKDLHFFILSQRFPDRSISSYFAKSDTYREHLLKRFCNKALPVFDLQNNDEMALGSIEEMFPTVYFVNSKCTDCDLNAILSELGQTPPSADRSGCIIFSVYSSSSIVKRFLERNQIAMQAFIDKEDSLQIMDKIIGDRQRMVRFERSEFGEGK